MIGLEFLKGVDIFKGLNENQLVPIQAGCREKSMKAETGCSLKVTQPISCGLSLKGKSILL